MGQGASRDTEEYRNGYPGKKDDPRLTDNIRFYRNEIKSKPRGDRIEDIHKNWFGNYDLLEEHHGFIQWLFPIREDGMNSQAQQLQLHEAEAIRNDPVLQGRVLRSFELMLDFYGMKLDRETKTFSRSSKYKSRYNHLNHSGHNFLRITRILKCLGEVGLEDYKKPWCAFFISEISEGHLSNLKRSLGDFWIPVLKIEAERTELQQQAISLGLIEPPREKYPPGYGGRAPAGSGVRGAAKASSSASSGSSSAAPAEPEKKKKEEKVIEAPSPMQDDSQEEAKSPAEKKDEEAEAAPAEKKEDEVEAAPAEKKEDEAEAAPIVPEVVNAMEDDSPKDQADGASPDDAPAV